MNTPSQQPSTINSKIKEDKPELEFWANEVGFSYLNPVNDTEIHLSMEKITHAFYQNGAIDLGILPPVVRYISNDFLGCIIERPPQMCSLEMKHAVAYGSVKSTIRYNIPLPWTVYGVRLKPDTTLDKLYVFYRNNQIYSLKDPLFMACLPNLGVHGQVCLDAVGAANRSKKVLSLAEGINTAISNFWGGLFNLDMQNQFSSSCPNYILAKAGNKKKFISSEKFFEIYESLNLDEALEIEYKTSKYSMIQLIEQIEPPSLSLPGTSKSLLSYFTPIINKAQPKNKKLSKRV